MFIPTANCARVAVNMTTGLGTPVVNTFWFQKGSPYSTGDLEDLGELIDGVWASEFMPLLSDQTDYGTLELYAQDSNTAPSAIVPAATPTNGGISLGTELPYSAALTVTLFTQSRGRSGRGRVFLGPFRGSSLDTPKTWVNATVVAAAAAVVALKTAAAANGHTLVVVSHFHDKVALSAGVARPVAVVTGRPGVHHIRQRIGSSD